MESSSLQPSAAEVIVLSGPLDQYGSETLKNQVLPLLDGQGDAVFDMGELDRMHTSALQVLIALREALEPKGRAVVLKSVEPWLRRLFRISGTEHLFTFVDGSRWPWNNRW